MNNISRKYLKSLINETVEENAAVISMSRIYDRRYVRDVLGIDLLLNESYPYSPATQERILEEQLQLEGFFSDFKKLGGDTKNSALALRYIMEDPSRISAYVDIIKSELEESYEALKEFLENVTQALQSVLNSALGGVDEFAKDLKTAAEWAAGLLGKITDLVSAALNAKGWKGAMVISGALVGIGYIWSMFSKSAPKIIEGLSKVVQTVSAKMESFLLYQPSLSEVFNTSPEIFATLNEQSKLDVDKAKAQLSKVMKDLMGSIKKIGPKVVAGLAVNALAGALTGGIGTAFKALQTTFGGAKIVFKFLGGPLEKFVSKIKNPEEEMAEAEAGKDDPTDSAKNESAIILTRSQLRSIVNRSINTV